MVYSVAQRTVAASAHLRLLLLKKRHRDATGQQKARWLRTIADLPCFLGFPPQLGPAGAQRFIRTFIRLVLVRARLPRPCATFAYPWSLSQIKFTPEHALF